METKKCPQCGEVEPASGFYTASTKGGLASWCKDCQNARTRQRYHEKKLVLQKGEN